MALETNAWTTGSGSSTIIPNLYNEQAEKYLYEREKLRPLGIDKSGMIRGKPGNSFETFTEEEFSVGSLTEGTDTPVSALDFGSVTLTIGYYGDAKQISKEALAESFSFLLDDLRFGASGALGQNRDDQVMTELLNTTTSAVYPMDSGSRVDDTNIDSDNTFTYEQITEADTQIIEANGDGVEYVIIHPRQKKAVLNDENFIDNNKYPMNILMNGQIGEMAGAKIIVSNAVQSVTENSTTVYQAIALGPRAFMYAQKLDPVMEFDEETKRKRGLTFHYWEAFGVKILKNDFVIPLKSA